MSKGWVVVKFVKDASERPKNVEWFAEQFEAEERAEELNQTASPNEWFGWERNT